MSSTLEVWLYLHKVKVQILENHLYLQLWNNLIQKNTFN